MAFIPSKDFQTPPQVCEYMSSFLVRRFKAIPSILEPTPGEGNLVKVLSKNAIVVSPEGDFWDHDYTDMKFDAVVMNPPFNPTDQLIKFVYTAMELSDIVIALVPWTFITNSENRLKHIRDFGLKSVTSLPRKTFPRCRTQTCVIELNKGYHDFTHFKQFFFDGTI